MIVLIPTVGRWDSLLVALKSVDIRIPVLLMHDFNYEGSVKTRNECLRNIDDDVLYATDDIEFSKGSLNQVRSELGALFPDGDGVVGLTQLTPHHPSGVALVGRKFLKRYPKNQLFNPAYHHFSAQEIYDYAKSLNKFYSSKATLIHRQNFKDNTAVEARRKKSEDLLLYERRKKEGKTWPLA